MALKKTLHKNIAMDEWIKELTEDKRVEVWKKYKEAKDDDERVKIISSHHPKGYINIEPVKYLDDFLRYVRLVSTSSTWYRGESKEHKLLIPKLYRGVDDKAPTDILGISEVSKVLKKERQYFQEFRRRAKSIVNVEHDDIWSWYFLIQHYGGSTRLLVWSSNPLIALFMALDTSRDSFENPIVYLLASTVLTDYAFKDIGKDNAETGRVLYPGEDDTNKWISNIIDNDYNLPDSPIALLPANSDQRIVSQKSCFTLFGKRLNGFVKEGKQIICPCCDSRILFKIIIDGTCKNTLREELKKVGVSSDTVYLGLEGLTKELNEEIFTKK